MKNRLLLAAIFLSALATAASLLAGAQMLPLPGLATALLRWLAILLIAAYAASRRSLTAWIFVGLLAGAELGHDAPAVAVKLQLLGTIFLRLIKVIIAPLLFGVLVVGIAGHADLKKVGRLSIKSLIYFEIVSTIAMLIGFAAIHISRAGEGVRLPPSSAAESVNVSPHTATQLITDIFPENIAKSVAEGQVLQIVVFSVLFAMALILVPDAKRRPMLTFAESLSETMFKFANLVMYAAPLGVFGAVAYTVGHLGLGALLPLLKLLATMYVALAFFIVCVLLPIALWARIPIKRFMNAVAEPVTIGFATASSEATLPRAIEQLESFGVPREIVPFVLPTDYSFNLDGASLYQSLALFFVVQAAGLHFSIGEQVLMMLTLLISSKGTAGVARFAADCFRRGDFVSPAHGTVVSSFRHRSAHGHGTKGGECPGQLRRLRFDCALGRRIPCRFPRCRLEPCSDFFCWPSTGDIQLLYIALGTSRRIFKWNSGHAVNSFSLRLPGALLPAPANYSDARTRTAASRPRSQASGRPRRARGR